MKQKPFTTESISLKNVKSAYVGINGKCCCGCSGEHWYAAATRKEAGVSRGYEITDDEVNDEMVKDIFDVIKKGAAKADVQDTYIALIRGKTLYIVYFA